MQGGPFCIIFVVTVSLVRTEPSRGKERAMLSALHRRNWMP